MLPPLASLVERLPNGLRIARAAQYLVDISTRAIGRIFDLTARYPRRDRLKDHFGIMLENLSVLFASGELTFAEDLALRKDVLAELETFQLETTAAGNQVITQGRSGDHHGDLAIALAGAAFASEYLRPGFTGVGTLENVF